VAVYWYRARCAPATSEPEETRVARLSDLPDYEVAHLLEKAVPRFESNPFVRGGPVSERRFALITSAGIHRRGDDAFHLRDAGYRLIPGDATDLVMTHSSVNFDRTGFQDDVNVLFPIDRFRELEAGGAVGSLATVHYAFMGASLEPAEVQESAQEIAPLLKRDRVDTVFLTPV
jgi:D-proline reductase (dithiol) PrdB